MDENVLGIIAGPLFCINYMKSSNVSVVSRNVSCPATSNVVIMSENEEIK